MMQEIMGVSGCSGISWTICKQFEPRSRHITTLTPHHSIFTDRMLFLTPNGEYQSTEVGLQVAYIQQLTMRSRSTDWPKDKPGYYTHGPTHLAM